MQYIITSSDINPNHNFVLNGLEYQKYVYTIEYGSYEMDGEIPVNVMLGLVNKYNGSSLVPASPYYRYSDSVGAFSSLNDLISHLSLTIGFVRDLFEEDERAILFVERVELDGGYVEGRVCLTNELNAFPDADAGRVIFDAFRVRVVTDGGYVEGFQCLINELNAFPDADAGRVIFDAFRVRVVTDGGYAEAKFCTVNEINSLI